MLYFSMKRLGDRTEIKTMELCEGCDKLIDMKQDEGDYVYYRKENDQVAHPFCNICLEKNDYNEPERIGDPEQMLKDMGYEKEVA